MCFYAGQLNLITTHVLEQQLLLSSLLGIATSLYCYIYLYCPVLFLSRLLQYVTSCLLIINVGELFLPLPVVYL